MREYMDNWDEGLEAELEEARLEAEENGEEFDEDEWLEEHRSSFDDEYDFTEKDTTDAEDPWAEEDHEQHTRKDSSGTNSNHGLRQAEQHAGDFYDYAHMEPDDGHGISVPQLTAFETDDDEKVFRKPESADERHFRKMDRIAQKYERNSGPGGETESDDDERTCFDDWVESSLLSSREEKEDREEPEAHEQLTDYEDDIIAKAEDRILEFFADGKEEEHFRRLREDSRYVSSADREYYDLHRELINKLELYEDRTANSPHDNDLYLPHVLGAMEAIDDANHLYAQNRERKEELEEMHEAGELSDMQYQDQSIALDCRLQRRLTGNEYKAISGGVSMFDDVGGIMDRWNNLLDDALSGDPDTLQDMRDFISQLPREVADQLIDEAVDEGLLDRSQACHIMTMAARPTNSLSGTPKQKKQRICEPG
ncbi:hypothetical protein PDESU_03635 [Pontiella desulfatans]|uniref:Uncharacterized protein n=1 Tax=Pontiella desulfatans TaxID=2750659 RepID=A0A6C2U578_PONDE|nr:hypothetical protein [Pontiella desulfatans]VGO15055.1 hypothetical protein PDESU_03635 [Pontiella desulfatans]